MSNVTTSSIVNASLTTEGLKAVKYKDLAPIYNEFAVALGRPTVKKFSDKPTSIVRILDIQTDYRTANPAKQVVTVKPANAQKPPKSLTTKSAKAAKPVATSQPRTLSITGEIKEGTTNEVIAEAINDFKDEYEQVVQFVLDHYTRPRSDNSMTRAIVVRRISRAVKAGVFATS